MNKIYFIIILIFLLIFFKFNDIYKKHHDNKSILDESKVKKTITDATIIDNLFTIGTDASVIAV
jgi:hypothetical protein